MANRWSTNEVNILKKHYGVLSNKEIHKKYLQNRSATSIRLKAQLIHVAKHYADYKFELNEQTSYFLGLLAADGCLHGGTEKKKRYTITIQLQQSDGYLLEEIQKILGIGHIYKLSNRKAIRLSIDNKSFFNQIISLGITPRKTFSLKLPKIPEQFYRDFVRGYFDGDGSIFYHKQSGAYRSQIDGASEEILLSIKNIIESKANPNGGSIRKYKNKYYAISYAKHDTTQLGKWMYYPGCIKMKRKHEKFIQAISI